MDDRADRRSKRSVPFALLCLLAVFTLAVVTPQWQIARAQSGDAASSSTPEVKPSKNILVHIVTSAGYFLPVLVLVSIALVTLIVLLAMDLRMAVAIPPQFVDEF